MAYMVSDEANRQVVTLRNYYGEEIDLTTEENNVYGLVIELNTDSPERGRDVLRKVEALLASEGFFPAT